MKATHTDLPEVLVIEPDVFGDDRGFFLEIFRASRYAEFGVPGLFLQDNWSRSRRGTLRGLHFQEPKPQGKLVYVVQGAVFDVAVDVRRGSPRFGKWVGMELSEANRRQLWVPPGFAHAFCVTSEVADFIYKCTDVYSPETERAVLWNDPDIGIRWPIPDPLLSKKDAAAPRLKDAPILPAYRPGD
jgi:dTDP-4-dehydrorhamnose 3,5-epimerase